MARKITDEEILQDILACKIVFQNGDVFTYNAARHCYEKRKPRIRKGRRQYQLTKGPRDNRRHRTIQGAKLIWMTENRCHVPDGMDVEHSDGNPMNDYPSNLILRDKHSNRSENNGHTMKEAYSKGYTARHEGIMPEENPYPPGSNRYFDWEKGYHSACAY